MNKTLEAMPLVGKSTMQNTESSFLKSLTMGVTKTHAITELIDNAIQQGNIIIIKYDPHRRILTVTNNGKPFKKSDLRRVFYQAMYNGQKSESAINNYGVGSKKAILSLIDPNNESEAIYVTNDCKSPYGVKWCLGKNFTSPTSEWIETPSWDDIPLPKDMSGTTLTITNVTLSFDDIRQMKERCRVAYSRYMKNSCRIIFNDEELQPFDPYYLHDLSCLINRDGDHCYFRNSKVFRIINADVWHKDNPDEVFRLRCGGVFIPALSLADPRRCVDFDQAEFNVTKFHGVAITLGGRYIVFPFDNTQPMLGKNNNHHANGRCRIFIDLTRSCIDLFKVDATKDRGLAEGLFANTDLKDYYICINGKKLQLYRFLVDTLWKWEMDMYRAIDMGHVEVDSLSDDLIQEWSNPKKKTIITPPAGVQLPKQNLDLDVARMRQIDNPIINTTKLGLSVILEENGVPENISKNIIKTLLDDQQN